MQFKMLIGFVIILLLASGCTNLNTKQSQQDDGIMDTESINYEKEKNQNERLEVKERPMKDYLQSDEEGIAKDGNERNLFSTEESLEISQLLSKREDIRNTQVATLKDKVIVFVVLNDIAKENEDIAPTLEKDIRKIEPNKEIVIFTDEYQWNRMMDLDASLKQKEIGENLEEYIEKYFNINIKD